MEELLKGRRWPTVALEKGPPDAMEERSSAHCRCGGGGEPMTTAQVMDARWPWRAAQIHPRRQATLSDWREAMAALMVSRGGVTASNLSEGRRRRGHRRRKWSCSLLRRCDIESGMQQRRSRAVSSPWPPAAVWLWAGGAAAVSACTHACGVVATFVHSHAPASARPW
jgi:hypothetical protein